MVAGTGGIRLALVVVPIPWVTDPEPMYVPWALSVKIVCSIKMDAKNELLIVFYYLWTNQALCYWMSV